MQFNHVEASDGTANIAAVVDGIMYVADNNHPNYEEIVRLVNADDDSVVDLFDATAKVAAVFDNLSERVSVAHGRLYFDGDEIADAYAEFILRLYEEDDEDGWEPLVLFIEKVYTNTDEHTRDNLSRWLKASNGFTIDADGDIIGYKGLTADRNSIHTGGGYVNGVKVDGAIPNADGTVITMPRSEVTHDPRVGCAPGLHVGTWDYARSFGRVVVKVKVNPRDVVSVPTECSDQKMRVSRYKVVEAVASKDEKAVIPVGFVPAEDFYDEYDFEDFFLNA